MARRRRRHHDPDPFQRALRAFFGRLTGMGWLVLAGAVSVAFILVGFVFLSGALDEVEDTAWEKFDAAATPEEVEEIARSYGRHVGPHAYLRLGNMLFEKAQDADEADEKRTLLSRARDGFSKGARLYPEHFLAPSLLEGEGVCLEEMGRNEEAFAAFERAYEADPKGHLAPKLDADMGRNLVLAGDEERAIYYLYRAVDSGVRVSAEMEADWLLNSRLLLAKVKSKEVESPAGGEATRPEEPEGEPEAPAEGAEAAPKEEAPAAAEEEAEPETPPAPDAEE